jgi:Fur family transcriptional regulator, peroxide stress response regulator
MPHTDARFNEMIAALKESDFRLTPQRVELVRLIAASAEHPSAAQLYTKIKAQFPTMSQATVYKTLALLKDMGQVLEIDLRDDSHYDGHRPHPHPHLVCTQCYSIIDGVLNLDPAFIRKLEDASGYRIVRPQVIFYGLCPNCAASAS